MLSNKKWIFVALTSTLSGVTNFYSGDTSNEPTLSGAANQSAGTPAIGGVNVNISYSSTVFDGLIHDLRVYNDILTVQQITDVYNQTIDESGLTKLIHYVNNEDVTGLNTLTKTDVGIISIPASETTPTEDIAGVTLVNPPRNDQSEQNVLAEETAAFIAKDKSTKVCTSSGTTYVASTQAYGVWEFDLEKGADGNSIITSFVAQAIVPDDAYRIFIFNNESIFFQKRVAGGNSTLFVTVASYIENNTHYRIRVERNETLNQYHTGAVGSFAVYIKGGSFGWADWTLVDPTGGSGTNPVVDNTYTTSAYIVGDLDSGDKFGNLTKNLIPVAITDFTDGTGTYEIAGEFFDKDGNAVDKPLSELVTNDYITVIKDSDNVINDIQIKK